jgi:integrase
MVKVRIKGVRAIKKRLSDGSVKLYYYHRATNKRLPDNPDSPQFAMALAKCRHPNNTVEGTMSFLIERYQESHWFTKKKDKTRSEYRRYCDIIRGVCGDNFVDEMTPQLVYEIQDSFAATPRKADMVVAVLRVLFRLGMRLGLRHDNPAAGVESINKSESYERWPDDVVDLALAKAPAHIRTPIMLALYTGQRMSDVLKMTWGDIDGDGVKVKQDKTEARVRVFLHPDLATYLGTLKKGPGRIALNSKGKPWTVDGFKSSWSTFKGSVPGLEGYVFHGYRHTAASRLYEAGCSVEQIMAITGHKTERMVRRYIQGAEQAIVARAAILKLTENAS